ncbi:2-hydroxychromene-2-carboxylate isomerase [Cupriavidus sp. HPC(L)]|uniref:2-hydroxychromene-2-carboxylate isomerase n=1 Tax=Cupriavidus TaxID=106589 RepID=UPI0002918789|nr:MULTISPECIES: 2-hydroxychromene-2-carboxylate isomerase [Cupriavidus]ESJ26706.1 2-hydroxychromene-2-carboxylate isomerase [Cupriavidus sp. HPC(L)]
MSTAAIDYYFWMNSDWAYLGADRLEAIVRRHDIAIRYRPVDLPEIYARTGGILLHQRSPERQAYRLTELRRWCDKLGMPINPKPAFMCPNADLASCIVIAADSLGLSVGRLHKAILHAQWCDDQDISSEATLRQILIAYGMDDRALLSKARTAEISQQYRRYTDEAVAAGVFGSPSYVYRGELFWGQDRLEMLEETIEASQERSRPDGS